MTVAFAPGTVAAGTAITLPGGVRLQRIRKAQLYAGSDGTAAATFTELTPVTGTPAAGQIRLSSETQVVLGDTTDAKNILIIVGDEVGSIPVA